MRWWYSSTSISPRASRSWRMSSAVGRSARGFIAGGAAGWGLPLLWRIRVTMSQARPPQNAIIIRAMNSQDHGPPALSCHPLSQCMSIVARQRPIIEPFIIQLSQSPPACPRIQATMSSHRGASPVEPLVLVH